MAAGSSAEFDALLEAARRGDASAWETLWQECRPYLFAVAMRSPGNSPPQDCSSIVQEGMARAFERILQFRGQTKEELLGWMARIVSNKALDRIDKRHNSPLVFGQEAELMNEAGGTSPSASVQRRERAARVLEALEALPADYQEVIRRRYFDDLSYEEIARRMNRTNESVRWLCVRAVRRLGTDLGEEP